MVLRSSNRISRVPPYLIRPSELPIRGCHPLWLCFPTHSSHSSGSAGSRSLAATREVSIDVLSFGYLDVSVPRVRFLSLCIQNKIPFTNTGDWPPDHSDEQPPGSVKVGFPIRIFPDQSLLATPRNLTQRATSFIASCHQGIHQTPF